MSAKQKVLIIGAGVAGMACAIRLAVQDYKVTIFEKNITREVNYMCWKKMVTVLTPVPASLLNLKILKSCLISQAKTFINT
jgi:flavin-dependent dehydrogenase